MTTDLMTQAIRIANDATDRIRVAKSIGYLSPEVVYQFARLILEDDYGLPIKPAPHHKLWMELVCDESIRKLLIIAPPESAKTTWLVNAYLGCRLGFYPEQSVIIGAVSDDVAEKRSVSLRGMVTSPMWRACFPSVLPDVKMKWEQKEWSLSEGNNTSPGRLHPTMRAYGTGSSIIGSRANFILGDDLLDFDNTRTKHQRITTQQWFETSFLSRAKSMVGRVVLIGTMWNADDLYAHIRKDGKNWTICHVPLLSESEDGKFYAYIRRPNVRD